jgi:hypothetical protein
MRKLFLILLIPTLAIGQIKKVDESEKPVVIGKAKNITAVIATMHKVSGDPDYFFVTFNNIKYQTINDVKSFGFKDVDGAFDYLYSSVAAAAKERKKEIEFELEDGRLNVSIVRAVGVINVQFKWFEYGVLSVSGYMTPKQYSALFDKPYNKKDWK